MKVKRHPKQGCLANSSGNDLLGNKIKEVGRPARDKQSNQEQHLDNCAEQQHLAEELLASEEQFRITFEQAPVGMAQVGLDGRWLLVNQKLCALLGYTQDELLERTFHAVMLRGGSLHRLCTCPKYDHR